MRLKQRAVAVAVGALGLTAAVVPAQAWTYQWKDLVTFTTFTTNGYYFARVYDIKCDATPVRAQYHRINDVEYNLYNNNGCGTNAQGSTIASRIDWAILCNDYPVGDDCSPKHYG